MKKYLPIIIALIALIIIVVAGGAYLNSNTASLNDAGRMGTDLENEVASPETAAERFEGTITAYDTGCFADAICSVTVDDKVVVITGGFRLNGEMEMGSLTGVPSIGDLESKIGSKARVYAEKTGDKEYTLYGNNDYFVEVL